MHCSTRENKDKNHENSNKDQNHNIPISQKANKIKTHIKKISKQITNLEQIPGLSANNGHLCEQRQLFDTEWSSGSEQVECKIDGGSAMSVPAPSLAAIRPQLLLLRHNRDLPAVEELQQEEENLISDGIHRN